MTTSEQQLVRRNSKLGRKIMYGLFVFSGLLPVLGALGPDHDTTLLIYTLFVAVVLIRRVPQPTYDRRWGLRFALATIGCGLLLECFSWTSNFLKCAPEPALLHPQLLPDLALAIGFYGAWALAWLLLLRWHHFTPRQLFITQGLFGILIERNGMIFLTGLLTLPLGVVFWLYVFLAYGSVMGLASRIAGVPETAHQRKRWWKFPIAGLAILVASLLLFSMWYIALQAGGMLPAPQPICLNPLR